MRLASCIAVVAALGLCPGGVARAETLRVERRIELPTGRPAAGARVLLRSLNARDGTLKQEKRVVADERGVVSAEIAVDSEEETKRRPVTGYMMVDVPGMALAFENFENWRHWRDASPLRLGAGYAVEGKVLTQRGEPVAGAEVVLAAFASEWSNWRIHYPGAYIVTPEVVTRSGADGSFALRPVDIVERTFGNGPPVVRPLLIARAARAGAVWIGRGEPFARRIGAPARAVSLPPNILRVYPGATVRGRIVSASSGKAITGARVVLRAAPGDVAASGVRPAISGRDGAFAFQGVPASFQLFAEATHPNFGLGWTRVGEARSRITEDAPARFDNVEIRLRPWAKASGRVIDVATKRPPVAPISIQSIYEPSYDDGQIRVGPGVVVAPVKPDGTFTMKIPVGPNHLLVRGPGYREAGEAHPVDLDVPPAGVRSLVLGVRRENGFFVRFSSAAAAGKPDYDFDREYDLRLRGADGKETSTNWGEWWYWPLYKPGDTLEIRVTRLVDGFVQEVVPWTRLTPADPKRWPRRIRLPLRQTVTLRGKVVDATTGEPLPGATLRLVSRPEAAAKNVAPVTSGADGSFVFSRVPLAAELSVTAIVPKWPDSARVGSARVGPGTLSAAPTDADEGHQEFKDIVVAIQPD